MKRIAVWNTAFLGDAVLTLPLIQTLADAFPGSEIDFYVRRGLASLFEAHPALHAVYEYDKRRKIPAGTRFEDLPEDWTCPVCGASKKNFKPLSEA